jgi:hypothetical protein
MATIHILTHTLFYNFVVIGYLLILMMSVSPRIWGYSDFSDEIKVKVPPQIKKEKRFGVVLSLPWLAFTFGFPILSTYLLKAKLGGEISYWTAFLNIVVMSFTFNLIDLVVLDWIIVSWITPNFVMIPGTEKEDYEDFRFHYKAQGKASIVILAVCFIFAFIVWYF